MNVQAKRWENRGRLAAILGICWYGIWGLGGMSVGRENLSELPLIEIQEGFAWMLVSGNFFFFLAGILIVASGVGVNEKQQMQT